MNYHLNADAISLKDLEKRIKTADLVPSRRSLLKGLEKQLDKLGKHGLVNLADLRNAMKTTKKLDSLTRETGIEKAYLVLLRREINSYFPKPYPLKSFDWLPEKEINALENAGIKNTALFYQNTAAPKKLKNLRLSLPIRDEVFHQISCLCDLTRMQWTSPIAARMFFDARYDSVQKIASADPHILCNALNEKNEGHRYFKGEIRLKDMKRLINSAGYL